MLDLTLVAATDAVLAAKPAEVRHLIGGEWRASADGATCRLLRPGGRGVERERAHLLAFARAARAGTVWTNTWMDGFAELPFGGMKESGQGRELGRYGLDEFLEVKTVQMRIGRTRAPWVAAG